MMRFDGKQVAEEFKKLFGHDLTPEQCRWLVKVAKHCRGRCRSNVALKNYLSSAFPNLKFSEVPREWKGKQYMALEVSERTGPAVAVVEESDE